MSIAAEQAVRTAEAPAFATFLNPWRMGRNLWRHRELIGQLAWRDVEGRYKATRLGLLWSVLTPLCTLVVYTFVFTIVFKARWRSDPHEGRGQFALTMFCGILLYNLFVEVVNRAPGMVVGNPNYVKKVVFPLEVFVPSALVGATVNMLIGYGVWLLGWCAIRQEWLHWTAALFPLAMLPVCLLALAIGWILASLGVFLRDVGHAVTIATQVLFFITPIFYSMDQVPYPYRRALELNPLAHAVEDVRRVLMWGELPAWDWWLVSIAVSAVLAVFGYAFFLKSKRAFADVV